MAWRDSRTYRKRLGLFTTSIVLGTAALVAINSLKENLTASINAESKSLLGADLLVEKSQSFSAEETALFDSLKSRGNDLSTQVEFSSMVLFKKNGNTRLAIIRAVEGNYPYYGEFKTAPQNAHQRLQNGQFALVDEGLMMLFGASVGDSLKIGALMFEIAGMLEEIPGESAFETLIGPRVYIPQAYLQQTELIQQGSRTKHKVYFKTNSAETSVKLQEGLKSQFDLSLTKIVTAKERQVALGKAMENLYRFLNLTGFMALLLGSIGIASAVNVYVKQKLETVAVLRCLGTFSWQMLSIYLIQAMSMSLLGTLAGAVIGVGLQYVLPIILADFLPVSIEMHISPLNILQAAAVSLGITLNFALLPLLPVRKISPLLALRSAYENGDAPAKDPLRWLIYAMIAIGISIFSVVQIKSPEVSWWHGLLFPLGVSVVVGALAAIAGFFIYLLRKFFPENVPYLWRQGLANLFRPNNQSIVLVLSIGLGAFFISTLYFTQDALLSQLSFSDKNGQPNLVLFDIQADQKQGVEALVKSERMPVMQDIPIVTMRIAKVNDVWVSELNRDSVETRAYFWEYRTTYRDTLNETESILAGKFHGKSAPSEDVVEVSLAEFLTKRLKVGINDTIIFDVQGLPITARVSSIRKINFTRIQPSFSIVFPTGILEEAPQFFALVTRANSSAESARLQQQLVQTFPNVSAIDLELIINTLDDVLGKISLVIRFMAFFSIATGFTVLAGAVMTSRYQRVKESVLLRSLGALQRQVVQIMVVEYFFLGSLAATVGVGLALASSWALAHFFFSIDFSPSLWPILISIGLVIGTTVFVGLLVSRGIHTRSPLEVLRTEAL